MTMQGTRPGTTEATRPLSLAYYSPGWPLDAAPNGIVPYVHAMTEELRRVGHRVTILSLDSARGTPDEVWSLRREVQATNRLGRVLDALTYRFSFAAGMNRQAVRVLTAECRRLAALGWLDLIEMEESFGFARGLQKNIDLPVVVRLHGPWFLNGLYVKPSEREANPSRIRDEGRAIGDAFAVISPSRDVLERTRAYYGLPLADAEVVPPPSTRVPPEDRWRAEDCDLELILFVGRFDNHKGGDLVIEAFAEVLRRHPRARLRFAGPDRGFLDEAGRTWTIEEFVRDRLPTGDAAGQFQWLGVQSASSIHDLRRKAGLVVVASRYDNFPNTVTEAIAAGCPLVGAQAGGIPEMIQDGVNGLLFRAGDARHLAAQVCRLIEDRGLAARLGRQAGLDCERRYSPEKIAKDMESSYLRILDRWRAVHPPRKDA